MINERWSIFADHAAPYGEQQLQQGIAIFLQYRRYCSDPASLRLHAAVLYRQRAGQFPDGAETPADRRSFPPVGTPAPAAADRPPRQDVCHSMDDILQHGEFRIVMTPHLFRYGSCGTAGRRAATCRQQAHHVVLRTGHQVQVKPLRMAGRRNGFRTGTNEYRCRPPRTTYEGVSTLQHATIGKETADFRQIPPRFNRLNGCARLQLPSRSCTFSDCKLRARSLLATGEWKQILLQSPADCTVLIYR